MPRPKKVIGPSGRPINVGGPTWNGMSESDQQKALKGGFPKVSPGRSSKIQPPKSVKDSIPDKLPRKPAYGDQFVYVLIVTDLNPESNLIVFASRYLLEQYIQDPRRGRIPVKMMNDALERLHHGKTYSVVLTGNYRIFRAPVIDKYPNYDYKGYTSGLPTIPIL